MKNWPNLTVPRFLFPFERASRPRQRPDPRVSATNHKRHGSGEPSGFIGLPLRPGRTRNRFLEEQIQTRHR